MQTASADIREFIVKNFNQNLDGEIHLWSALLDQPDESIIIKDRTNHEPQFGLEKELAVIWKKILEIGHIRNSDNFFEIGGNSLLAIKLIYRLNEKFNIDLPLSIIFEASTLAEMSLTISDMINNKLVTK